MQARIPEPDGETVITRYTLGELLDRLDELTTGPNGQPGCEPRSTAARESCFPAGCYLVGAMSFTPS